MMDDVTVIFREYSNIWCKTLSGTQHFTVAVQSLAHVDKYLIGTPIGSSLEFVSSQIIPMKSEKAEF